jgi:hypothetical protein
VYNSCRFRSQKGNPVGERGHSFDADAFRNGNTSKLSKVVEETVAKLSHRVKLIKFSENEGKPGGAKARIEAAINQLGHVSEQIPLDYHF